MVEDEEQTLPNFSKEMFSGEATCDTSGPRPTPDGRSGATHAFTHRRALILTFTMADDTAFDIVVLGTGLTESITAA